MSRSLLAVLTALAFVASPAGAQQKPAAAAASGAAARITHHFQGLALAEAMARLFEGRPESVLVMPEVAQVPVHVHLKEVSWTSAVDQLLRMLNLEMRREGGVQVVRAGRGTPERVALGEVVKEGESLTVRLEHYPLQRLPELLAPHLGRDVAPVPAAVRDRRVTVLVGPLKPLEAARAIAAGAGLTVEETSGGPLTLALPRPVIGVTPAGAELLEIELRQVPLRDAYAALLPPGTPVVVRPEIGELPVSMKIRTTRESALELLTQYARGYEPRLEARSETSGYQVYLRAPGTGGKEGTVTADLRDVPLREALRLVFKGTGTQYAVEPTVPNVPVTVHLQEVEIPRALRLLVQLAAAARPGITLRREADVWVIGMRRTGV